MASSPSRRRRRIRRGEVAVSSPDWADLPIDALLSVLHKLDPIELLVGGAGRVCRSWRRAARDEPVLWRRIDMRVHKEHPCRYGIAKEAVRRGAGRCEAFWGERVIDDDFLLFLAERAPSLKSLRLISSNHISNEGFLEAINKFPMLEELEISLCKNVFGKVYEVIGIACPHLTHFRVSYPYFYSIEDIEYNKNEEALGIATMFVLRSLQLFGCELTNVGLAKILDNCAHLEHLDIRHCFNIHMDTSLRAKCARIKTLKLPYDSTDDYEFQIGNSVRTRSRRTRRDYAEILMEFPT
ncbi:putative F-box/LRR-repeat protein 23 [Brachypodium distachyon]|uniref:F-box domain-containing protein n=1 Tax=Brachypodium distachyon TaxID=15368 RepID=I1HKV3_BRADI|nr:putative F-box/LRR-repeat protein 23 [Brachypodium distachyon]KQK07021.1 hypothetical protein BRADI_2g32210v3 [Brachypodium distachyon]|eukprot:XP_010231592.1 putative F-box/LRR-repeat protein 23 [Brachypodium distachyon]